jgi:4-hydroxy-3-methylbut-2-en-1-yl diphosphate reductase
MARRSSHDTSSPTVEGETLALALESYAGHMVERVILARPRGYCAGVVMAIDAVRDAALENKVSGEGDLVVYHAIVHNNTVVERLEADHGVRFVEDLAELDAMTGQGQTVVFSAHGISPVVRLEAERRGLTTLDATCPLVTKVHSESKRYAALGYTILLIGDSATHQEIIGTFGEAPDNTVLVNVLGNRKLDPAMQDSSSVTVPDTDRVIVLTQTTLSVDDTDRTIEILKQRFPKLVIPGRSDLCYATKNRQAAVKQIAAHVDAFLVVSSNYSSNGMRLVELAEELVSNAHRIESVADIQPAWLEGVTSLGITSAASTPDDLVQAIVAHLRFLNPNVQVTEEGGDLEEIEFRAPTRVAAAQQAR